MTKVSSIPVLFFLLLVSNVVDAPCMSRNAIVSALSVKVIEEHDDWLLSGEMAVLINLSADKTDAVVLVVTPLSGKGCVTTGTSECRGVFISEIAAGRDETVTKNRSCLPLSQCTSCITPSLKRLCYERRWTLSFADGRINSLHCMLLQWNACVVQAQHC